MATTGKTKSRRIQFSAWGASVLRGRVRVPAYAMRDEYDGEEVTVANAIARKSGLSVWGYPQLDGYADGVKAHWAGTLVDSNNSPTQVWFSIEEGGR